jgi:uncharacterized peroxidase-related enzyme
MGSSHYKHEYSRFLSLTTEEDVVGRDKLQLEKLSIEKSEPLARTTLEAVRQKLGMVPNIYAYMANAPGLLETYRVGYEEFRQGSGFTPVEQEVVFLSISHENGCEYCMAAHSFLADVQSKVPAEQTEALREGRDIPDARLQALSRFTRVLVQKRGRPSKAELDEFRGAGYTDAQVLQIILALGVKTLSNYTNHVCGTPVDSAFVKRAWTKSAAG